MRWPLRYQILLPFAGVMLAVVICVSLLDAYLAARRTQHQIEDQLREVAGTLSDANFPLTDGVLKQTRGLSGAEFLLVDRRGKPQASSLNDAPALAIPPVATHSQFALAGPIEFAQQRYFHTAIAVRGRGTQVEPMELHILYPERFLREARWQAAYPPLAVGSILLGVVIALAIAIAGRLSRPILELRRQLSCLVHGDFQPVPLPKRNDELRDLIGSVNVLGDQLDELRRVIKRSERLALMGQLSGGLAHQLRNSVTGARLAVQVHQRHCGQIDPDSLAVALRQLAITEAHLQRFLAAGRPAAPQGGHCDLRKLISDVASLVGPSCHHRDVMLDLDGTAIVPVPDGTPVPIASNDTRVPCSQPREHAREVRAWHPSDGPRAPGGAESPGILVPVELWADADQFRQMLLNLVLNGIEAAGNGGWVRVALGGDQESVTLRVLDSGAGPPPTLVDRLFEPFATAKPEGIGLGLSVAKAIAEAHGGTIRYLGERPTCFEVVLPRNGPAGAASVDAALHETATARARIAPASGPECDPVRLSTLNPVQPIR